MSGGKSNWGAPYLAAGHKQPCLQPRSSVLPSPKQYHVRTLMQWLLMLFQAQARPAPQQQLRSGMNSAEHGVEPALRSGDPAVRVLRHEALQGQAGELDLDLAVAHARKQQQKTSR